MRLNKSGFIFALLIFLFAITCSNFLIPSSNLNNKLNETNSLEIETGIFFSSPSHTAVMVSSQLPESQAARNLAQIQEYLRFRIFRILHIFVPFILIGSFLFRRSSNRVFSLVDICTRKNISPIALSIGWHAPPSEA